MSKSHSDCIEIICGVDKAYAPHLAVMLRSVERTQNRLVRAHVLHDSVDIALQKKVEAAAPSIAIVWHSVVDAEVLALTPLLQISRATYFRLLINRFIDSAITRLLYLDVDVIVNAPLDGLWDVDFEGYACAAVPDPGVSAQDFAKKFDLDFPGKYFNAGIILFDLKIIRKREIFEQSLQFLFEDRERFELADQDALNVTLWNDWLELDSRWNFQRAMLYHPECTSFSASPAIIHFTESQKPWQASEWHPYAWLYLKNLRDTPFRAEVMQAGHISFVTICKSFVRYYLRKHKLR